MIDAVEWNPKHHGHKPHYWKSDMAASLDNKNFINQEAGQDWAWIAGSTYYVPYEAVHGRPLPATDEPVASDQAMINEERKALVGVMKDQIESWEFEDPREDWWKWQHQYARAADQIEADGQRIAELEAALRPVIDWYQSDEMEPRPIADIVADIVSDLQHDRFIALKMPALLKAADHLSVCAQTSGGTAGRDDGLVDAISDYSKIRAALQETGQ